MNARAVAIAALMVSATACTEEAKPTVPVDPTLPIVIYYALPD
jgi:hypothetical protein